MNRFFLIPLLALMLLAAGCACSIRGSATMPSVKPTAAPVNTAVSMMTAAPTMTAAPETVAPVEPTASDALPSASATAGN